LSQLVFLHLPQNSGLFPKCYGVEVEPPHQKIRCGNSKGQFDPVIRCLAYKTERLLDPNGSWNTKDGATNCI